MPDRQLAMAALLRANARAGELRREALHQDSHVEPGILRGAPTHSAAHLLNALDELGWELVPAACDADRYRQALTYLVERCDREFTNQNRPPELDFVMLAVGEVREKVLGDSPAGLDHVPLRDVVEALRAVDPPAGDSPHLWLAAYIQQKFGIDISA